MQEEPAKKKILENPVLASLLVPISIVLLGSLLIFGVTKMLSTDRDHRDLINELESKTFGNRWVAAYELSKLLAASKIPPQEHAFVIERLSRLYKTSNDARTRNFLITALASLRDASVLPSLELALQDPDSQVLFSAVAGIGNMPQGIQFNWDKLIQLAKSTDDEGLRQALILCLATHRVQAAEGLLAGHLQSSSPGVRYASALGLISFQNSQALPVLKEIFNQDHTTGGQLSSAKLTALKINTLDVLSKHPWSAADEVLRSALETEKNQKVQLKIKNYLQRNP